MFAKSSLIYLVGGVAVRASALILLPIVTRALDPSEFGALELLNRACDVLLLCLFVNGTCLASVSLYSQAVSEQERRVVASTALVFGLGCVALVGVMALAFAHPVGRLVGVDSPGLVRLAFTAALVEALLIVALTLLQARMEALVYVTVATAQILTRTLLVALFVWVLGWGLQGVFVASLIASGSLAAALVTREFRRSGLTVDRQVLGDLVRFALPFLPAGFCGLLLGTGDQFFLVKYVDTWEVGLYALGYKLALMVPPLTSDPLMKVWGVQMHQVAAKPEAPRVFGQMLSRFTILYLGVALPFTLFSPETLMVLSSPRYLPAASYVPLIALAYLMMVWSNLFDAAFYVKKRTQVKLSITVASTVVMLLLYVALIPRFHGMGAAYATLLGFMFKAALTYHVSQQLLEVTYPWGRMAAAIGLAAGCWCLGWLASGPVWGVVAIKAVAFLLFLAVTWYAGLVGADEKQSIVGLLERSLTFVRSLAYSVRAVPRDL